MTIRLVETETGRTLRGSMSPDMCGVSSAVFSPDGSRLVATTSDGPAVHIWDLRAIGQDAQGYGAAMGAARIPRAGAGLSAAAAPRGDGERRHEPGAAVRWTIDVPFKAVAPTLDGSIGPDEYGPAYDVRFDDARNSGILWAGTPARSKSPDDGRLRPPRRVHREGPPPGLRGPRPGRPGRPPGRSAAEPQRLHRALHRRRPRPQRPLGGQSRGQSRRASRSSPTPTATSTRSPPT